MMLLFSSVQSHAAVNAEAIYNALNVQEEMQPAPRTQSVTTKSVGGLICTKTDDIRFGVSFSCGLVGFGVDDQEIYTALNVPEQSLPAVRTELRYEKAIGGLSCVRINVIQKGDVFHCSLED